MTSESRGHCPKCRNTWIITERHNVGLTMSCKLCGWARELTTKGQPYEPVREMNNDVVVPIGGQASSRTHLNKFPRGLAAIKTYLYGWDVVRAPGLFWSWGSDPPMLFELIVLFAPFSHGLYPRWKVLAADSNPLLPDSCSDKDRRFVKRFCVSEVGRLTGYEMSQAIEAWELNSDE